MDIETIVKARREAKRFITASRAWIDRIEDDSGSSFRVKHIKPSKQGGACKRTSMDLTRVLADLRR